MECHYKSWFVAATAELFKNRLSRTLAPASERRQIFYEITLLLFGETKMEIPVVMVHDVSQCSETAVVIKTAFLMSPQSL